MVDADAVKAWRRPSTAVAQLPDERLLIGAQIIGKSGGHAGEPHKRGLDPPMKTVEKNFESGANSLLRAPARTVKTFIRKTDAH